MRYKARYSTGAAYEAALEDAAAMLREDSYYARYGGGGTGLLRAAPDKGMVYRFWLPNRELPAGPESVTVDDVLCYPEVGWTSCAGNRILYQFDHVAREVVVAIDSTRHGIPRRAMSRHSPSEVLEYNSRCREWSPWDVHPDSPPPAARIPS